MSFLREKLARRFCEIYGRDIWDIDEPANDKWRELADECIRQMEWARHEISTQYEYRDDVEPPADFELTYAPPSWQSEN